MQRCTLVKEFGLNFTYTPETDIHLEQTKKHHIQKTKKYAKKQKEKKEAEETAAAVATPSTSILVTSAQAGRNTANPFTTV